MTTIRIILALSECTNASERGSFGNSSVSYQKLERKLKVCTKFKACSGWFKVELMIKNKIYTYFIHTFKSKKNYDFETNK